MIIKKIFTKFLSLILLLLFFAFLGFAFETYEDFKIYQNNEKITEMTCEDFYNNPVKHLWVKLTKCEIDYDNILVKDLQEQILLPIKPQDEKYKEKRALIQVQVEDSSIYDKFIELSQKEDSTFEFVKILSKIGMFEFSGIVSDIKVIPVLKTGTNKSAMKDVMVKGKSFESLVEEKVSLYTLEWNEKPAFPSDKISILISLVIVIISFYIWRRKKKQNPLN